ncbi:PQQ-like beta-propeller repeat protein [Streptomyces sp. NBC_01216]|uniref:outer membrane protein assembly factor BamB family protein n=1 Tax=Streptomyces sp. NBC_01216 TaxID=2903778 RepID=UPI002E144352|nr:PQQ-like beta-propeller repeat protein [Streptomyces sp. NBC_01216]
MTQPPPPPNQPPGPPPGGFGAPQDPGPQDGHGVPQGPPPGGFGAPQDGFGAPQDPPPGGFGAPQDPPPGGFGAPAPSPQGQPYGYPQQPQPQYPPYGYPQQAPPAYGYPAPPQYPQAQPGPQGPAAPSGGRISAQLWIVIAAVITVVLLIGGSVWYVNSGGDNGRNDTAKGESGGAQGTGGTTGAGAGGKEKPPANTRSQVAFQLPVPKVPDITDVSGSWLTGKAYVKPGVDSVVGYDLDKGTPLWTLSLPGQVCGASRHVTPDNRTAILFEAAKRVPPKYYEKCTEVGVIDLDTGKLVWSTSVTGGSAGDGKARFSEVTLSGSTVAVGGLDGGAAFDLANGNPRWKPQTKTDNCYDMGYGGGPALAVARKCGPYGSQTVTIQNINPTTGAPISEYKMPKGVDYASIVSTKPLVVAADVGDTAGDGSGISDFFSIDEQTGKLKAKITADADRYAARCRSTKVESCTQALVGNGRLYLPTEEHDGSTGEYGDETNEIVSFDLATGKMGSGKADAGDRYTLMPLRMDGGNLIAYKQPPYDKGGRIVSIDGTSFKETLLLENPSDKAVRNAETGFTENGSEYRYADGRFFVSQTLLSKPRESSSTDDKEYLAVAFRAAP